MVDEPAVTPVTRPAASTVAFATVLLLHTPPETAFDSCRVAFWHTDVEGPVMAAGALTTVTLVVVKQVGLVR